MKIPHKVILNSLLSGFFLFSISILLPLNFRNIPFFVFAIIIVLTFKKPHTNTNPKLFKTLVVNTLYFSTMALSFLYSENTSEGATNLLSISPLLLTPVMFYVIHSRNKINYHFIIDYIYILFFSSTLLFFLLLIAHNYFQGYMTETYFLHFPERINVDFGKYSIHPLYASISVIISLIFSVPIYEKAKTKSMQLFVLIAVAFLIFIILLLARKSSILITSSIFIYYFLKYRNRGSLAYFGIVSMLCACLIYFIEPLRGRFSELISTLYSFDASSGGSTSTRLNIFNCSFDAIKKAPFFGYGVGDTKDVLNMCYLENNSPYFNTHNQFLGAWLSAGLFGVITLMGMFLYALKSALKANSFVQTSVLFLFFSMAMVENFLERQDGILIFSFFVNFFIFKNITGSILKNNDNR